jgi:hypothetical protein
MKVAFVGLLALAVGCYLVVGTQGGEKKEVTLKGMILCAKCELKDKDLKKCTTAIQVKEGDKTVTYYLDDKGWDEPYHDAVCGGGTKAGTVVGTVTEKDGKKWIRPTKVEYAK